MPHPSLIALAKEQPVSIATEKGSHPAATGASGLPFSCVESQANLKTLALCARYGSLAGKTVLLRL